MPDRRKDEGPAPQVVLKKTIRDARRAIVEAKVPYAVVGGVAVNAYGIPRTTGDFDIVVDLRKKGAAERLLAETRRLGFRKAPKAPDIRDAGMTTLVRGPERVDLIAAQHRAEVDQIETSVVRRAFGLPLKVASPERLIVFKAISSTIPGREKDLFDARELCRVAAPDRKVLFGLARQHGKKTVEIVRKICRR